MVRSIEPCPICRATVVVSENRDIFVAHGDDEEFRVKQDLISRNVKWHTLGSCEIWIENDHPSLGAMQYHPGIGWLKNNGHDPRLHKKVHIPHAKALLSRFQLLKHPAVILHELAHAYHDQILSFDHPEIIAAYDAMKKAGTYEKVLLFNGEEVRHYGLTNHKEYFAEGTEAYFYRNDFYPFVRAELKQHDPQLHDTLEKVWGKFN